MGKERVTWLVPIVTRALVGGATESEMGGWQSELGFHKGRTYVKYYWKCIKIVVCSREKPGSGVYVIVREKCIKIVVCSREKPGSDVLYIYIHMCVRLYACVYHLLPSACN